MGGHAHHTTHRYTLSPQPPTPPPQKNVWLGSFARQVWKCGHGKKLAPLAYTYACRKQEQHKISKATQNLPHPKNPQNSTAQRTQSLHTENASDVLALAVITSMESRNSEDRADLKKRRCIEKTLENSFFLKIIRVPKFKLQKRKFSIEKPRAAAEF